MDDDLGTTFQDPEAKPVGDPAVNAVLATLQALEEAPLHEHPAGLEGVHDALSGLLDGPTVPGIQAR